MMLTPRSRLPGNYRGLGCAKPHVEIYRGVWCAFDVVRAGPGFPFIGAEVVNRVGRGRTWLEALSSWAGVLPP